MITLTATASFGNGGKQFIAHVVGRNAKFIFNRTFVGKKGGKRGQDSEADVDEPGLYELRNIDNKGRDDNRYVLLIEVNGELTRFSCDKEDAMKIAKELDKGRRFEEIVVGYPADPEAEKLSLTLRRIEKKILSSPSEYQLGQTETYDAVTDWNLPEPELVRDQQARYVAERARLGAMLSEMTATGKRSHKEWEMVSAKAAETKKAAATLEQVTEACWQILASLPMQEARKALATLKARVSQPKTEATYPL